MQSNEQPRENECPQCRWVNGHTSWCMLRPDRSLNNSPTMRHEFLQALDAFRAAGMALVEVWADADEVAPLPNRLKPPLSLDDWLEEFQSHYWVALAEPVTVPDDDEITEWAKDGDPCNDCGMAANYDPANGWYYHVDPNVPGCFLMGSGPIEGTNDPMTSTYLSGNTRRGPARPANEQEAWRANAALARSYDAEAMPRTAHDLLPGDTFSVAANEVAPTIQSDQLSTSGTALGYDEQEVWAKIDANLASLGLPAFDNSGCYEIDLGPKVYGLVSWDGEYLVGLYFRVGDDDVEFSDEGGVCARFDDFSSTEAYVQRLIATQG